MFIGNMTTVATPQELIEILKLIKPGSVVTGQIVVDMPGERITVTLIDDRAVSKGGDRG